MVIGKKRQLALLIAMNILVVFIMVGVLSQYIRRDAETTDKLNRTLVRQSATSIADTLELYFEQQRVYLLSKKDYIQSMGGEGACALDDAMAYLGVTNARYCAIYQLVDCRTTEAFGLKPGEKEWQRFSYGDSYETIDAIIDEVTGNAVNDGILNTSAGFTDPMTGAQSIAFYTGLRLTARDGEEAPFALLCVVKNSELVVSGLPVPPYAGAHGALVKRSGDYIIKTAEFKSSNVYEFFRAFNAKLDYAGAEDIRLRVLEQGSGALLLNNAKGQPHLFAYSAVSGSDGWTYFAAVPTAVLQPGNIDFMFICIFVAFILILILMNGAMILRLNSRLKHSLESESAARAAAENANNAKSEFLSRMSHEIRTPLNAIIGYNTLARGAASEHDIPREQTDARVSDCLAKADIASRHLLSVINDVLDMSSIESGKMKVSYEGFDFKETINALTVIFGSMAQKKNAEYQVIYETPVDNFLVGDQMHVKQVLTNLLSNAVKFTPANGSITLRINQQEINENTVTIRFDVIDTGIGMDAEYLTRIWAPFEQEDSSISRRFGGTGLGLTITKKLVDLMGGTNCVASEKNVGSVFTVTLQFDRTYASQHGGSMFSRARLLLVVRDQSECARLMQLLKRFNITYDMAQSGDEARDYINGSIKAGLTYTCCIVDIDGFGRDGPGLLKVLSELADTAMPFVIISAHGQEGLLDDEMKAHVNTVLSKPVGQSELSNTLYNIMGTMENGEVADSKKYDFGGARILLAEDNLMNMEIAYELLLSVHLNVDKAYNGREAVSAFLASPKDTYRLILMDIHMPEMDGYHATMTIRRSEHPQAKSVPILAMTADAFAEDVKSALSAGMNDHIAKPIDTGQLYATLARYIKPS